MRSDLLPVHSATYKHPPGQQDWMTASGIMVPAVCPQRKAVYMGGRQDAVVIATLGDAVQEMTSLLRGSYRNELL